MERPQITTEQALVTKKFDIAQQLNRYLSDKDRKSIISNGLSQLSKLVGETRANQIMTEIIEDVKRIWENTKPPGKTTK